MKGVHVAAFSLCLCSFLMNRKRMFDVYLQFVRRRLQHKPQKAVDTRPKHCTTILLKKIQVEKNFASYTRIVFKSGRPLSPSKFSIQYPGRNNNSSSSHLSIQCARLQKEVKCWMCFSILSLTKTVAAHFFEAQTNLVIFRYCVKG